MFNIFVILVLTLLRLESIVSSSSSNQTFLFGYSHGCTNGHNKHKRTLHNLLNTFSSQTITTKTGFYNSTAFGPSTNTNLYGLYLCRGDIDRDSCRACVNYAKHAILTKRYNNCGQEAMFWYDHCMIRYSNKPVSGILDLYNTSTYSSWDNNYYNVTSSSNSTKFTRVLKRTMHFLAIQAANNGRLGLGKKFATKIVKLTEDETLYGLAQCTPDLTANDCLKCLINAKEKIREMGDSKSGQVIKVNCMLRYEMFPFFYTDKVKVKPSQSSAFNSTTEVIRLRVRLEPSYENSVNPTSSSLPSSALAHLETITKFEVFGFKESKVNGRKMIELEEGWEFMEKGITKLKRILEGLPEPPFTSEDYMMLYTTIYNMCTQNPPHDYSQQLYDNYKQVFVDYLKDTVLPSLRKKHDEIMLRELANRWSNHKVMVRWMSRFFHYLDRYFIAPRSLPSLTQVAYTCFRQLVYQEISGKAKDAVIALIDVEREGGEIDRALLKNVLDIYVDIGMGSMDDYENEFESPLLEDTAAYYSRKASSWILEDSLPEYMLKSEECLKKEKDRVEHYLHSNTEQKLLEKVQNELLLVYENQLLEKENSGCRALLKNDKVEDLSRMYRLYSKVPEGLESIGSIFKQHITDEGTALVQQEQAEDAALSKAENVGSTHEQQVFMRKVIELHNKFMVYVTDSFQSHTIFDKALKEAFEVFLNKGVSGSSSAQLLATLCDTNILKKAGNEAGGVGTE